MSHDKPLDRLLESVRTFAKADARIAMAELYNELVRPQAGLEEAKARGAFKALMDNRWFDLAEQLGEALVHTGSMPPALRRRYAQTLLERGAYDRALVELDGLRADPKLAPGDRSEVLGLMGRIRKDQFFRALERGDKDVESRRRSAIESYLDAYLEARASRTWHGINAVALLARARKDGSPLADLADPAALAQEILETVKTQEDTGTISVWDYATAGEACVALGRYGEAHDWLVRYSWAPGITAFNLGSTLRQLDLVWRLGEEPAPAPSLLDLLRARLVEMEHGSITVASADVQNALTSRADLRYEKVFGKDHFITVERYQLGLERCRGVARIGYDTARGEGTGFLLCGRDLDERIGEDLILVTNAHVLSEEDPKTIHPKDAVVCFTALDNVKPDEAFKVKRVLWSSPREQLDCTVAALDRAVEFPREKCYPVANRLPNKGERVLIIGHPSGGPLQFSINDNELVDYVDDEAQIKRVLHYRTPTEGGSSGSPVFNQLWQLIGLHHAGADAMPKLNGKDGTYQANEGIWVGAIIKAFRAGYQATRRP